MDPQGQRLKKIRLEKGLSIEEAQKKTKINASILRAIEGDGLTDLSPIYLKSFLKIYCKFLGVDPKDYLPDYKEWQEASQGLILTKETAGIPSNPPGFLESAASKLISLKGSSRKIKAAVIAVLIVIILAMACFKLGKVISRRRSQPASKSKNYSLPLRITAQKKQGLKLDKVVAVPVASGGGLEAKPKKQKVAAAGIRLDMRARENCWVFMKVDGRVVCQRVLEKGRSESWQAKDKIEISLGNAAAVELEVNGEPFPNLGRKGQGRKNILITKEGLGVLR